MAAMLCLLPLSSALPEADAGRAADGFSPDVPACPPLADECFAGAVLVGDSMAEPFALYGMLPTFTVLSVLGISPRTAASDNLFALDDGQTCTLAEKLEALAPPSVYLWLGSNGVDTKDAARVLEDYDALLSALVAALPHTPLYLLELPPVKLSAQKQYAHYTNARVDAFNAGLRALALRHGAYLLPLNILLKNDKGLLDDAYGAGDGIHLRRAAYEILTAYLYTHVGL